MKTFIIAVLLLITGTASAITVNDLSTNGLKTDMIFTNSGVYTVVETLEEDNICVTTRIRSDYSTKKWEIVSHHCEKNGA